MTTTSKVPDDVALPNRVHSIGQTMAEKVPARAAVTGVGVMFNSKADHRRMECGNDSIASAQNLPFNHRNLFKVAAMNAVSAIS